MTIRTFVFNKSTRMLNVERGRKRESSVQSSILSSSCASPVDCWVVLFVNICSHLWDISSFLVGRTTGAWAFWRKKTRRELHVNSKTFHWLHFPFVSIVRSYPNSVPDRRRVHLVMHCPSLRWRMTRHPQVNDVVFYVEVVYRALLSSARQLTLIPVLSLELHASLVPVGRPRIVSSNRSFHSTI